MGRLNRRRRNLTAVALVLGCFAPPVVVRAQARTWAVVVGINDYINLEGVEGGDLRGAEHDARSFNGLLTKKWGVPAGQVVLLLGRRATGQAIRSALTSWIPQHVGENDRVFFFYAGHGSQALDDNGDEQDGLDETISPSDVLPTSLAKDIRDDDLNTWLQAIPAAQVIVILDSCHSGTATRVGGLYARPRRLTRIHATTPAASETGSDNGIIDVPGGKIMEIAAAAPGESAMDVGFPADDGSIAFYGGAFSTHLIEAFWSAPATATFEDVFKVTRSAMKADHFAQDPQISGPTASEVVTPAAHVTAAGPSRMEVLVLDGDTAVVSHGSGMAPGGGALLATPEGGILRVLRVEPDELLTEVLQRPVAVGDSVIPAGRILLDPTLRVGTQGLTDRETRELKRRLLREGSIEWVSGSDLDGAHVIVARGEGRGLVLYGRDGLPRGVPGALQDDPLSWVVQRLKWEIALQRLASLSGASTQYAVDVDLNAPDATYREGDPIQVRVRSNVAGYVTLLALGTDGSLSMIVPNAWSGPLPIKPGEELRVPDSAAPFVVEAAPPFGLGFIEAIVTPEPLEFPEGKGIPQETGDAGAAASSILESIGRQMPVVRGVRIVGKKVLGPAHWGAGLASYTVLRPGG